MANRSQTDAPLLEWSFPEFAHHDRSRRWYVGMTILAVALLIWAIFTTNFLFAVIIVMAAVILWFKHTTPAAMVRCALWEDGLELAGRLYPYDDLASFYIVYDPPMTKMLYLDTKSVWQPRLRIDLEDMNPLTVRELLLEHITEDLERENEPLSEAFGRLFKL